MPCPESQLGGYENGLKRGPKSISKYDTPEFRKVCQHSASEVTEMIKAILNNDYEIVAILGIEFSPSCSIKLQYSNKGVFHQPGIFIKSLKNQLAAEKIDIPFLGINRRGMKKSLRELKELLSQQKNLLDF